MPSHLSNLWIHHYYQPRVTTSGKGSRWVKNPLEPISSPAQGQNSLGMPGDFCQCWRIQPSLLTDRNQLLGHHRLRFPLKTHTVCLEKGKHEISCPEELKSMEGQLISREERFCGFTQWHARFTSARRTLIFPPGSCTELAGGWKSDLQLFSVPTDLTVYF